jgi:hypothetical protein
MVRRSALLGSAMRMRAHTLVGREDEEKMFAVGLGLSLSFLFCIFVFFCSRYLGLQI